MFSHHFELVFANEKWVTVTITLIVITKGLTTVFSSTESCIDHCTNFWNALAFSVRPRHRKCIPSHQILFFNFDVSLFPFSTVFRHKSNKTSYQNSGNCGWQPLRLKAMKYWRRTSVVGTTTAVCFSFSRATSLLLNAVGQYWPRTHKMLKCLYKNQIINPLFYMSILYNASKHHTAVLLRVDLGSKNCYFFILSWLVLKTMLPCHVNRYYRRYVTF